MFLCVSPFPLERVAICEGATLPWSRNYHYQTQQYITAIIREPRVSTDAMREDRELLTIFVVKHSIILIKEGFAWDITRCYSENPNTRFCDSAHIDDVRNLCDVQATSGIRSSSWHL